MAKKEEKTVNAPPTKAGVQETAITNVSPTALSTEHLPPWLAAKMKASGPRGLEHMQKDDIIYPRLLLMQGLSPQVADGLRRVGEVVDNLTGDVIAAPGEEIPFIPVVMSRTRMYLIPIAEGGGMKCRSDDSIQSRSNGCGVDQGGTATRTCADCIHKEWDDASPDGKGKPKCTLFYNIVGLLPNHGFRPVVWSGKSTNTKVMRRFLSIATQTGADFFALKFALRSVDMTSGQFKFKNWDFKSLGFVSEDEYARGDRLYQSLKGKTWAPDTTDLETQGDTEFPPAD